MIPAIHTGPVEAGDESIRALIALIDELIAVVSEENTELAKGLPASRSKQLDDKNRLAGMFEQHVVECARATGILNVRDSVLREQLMERIFNLREAMDENLVRLRAAIDASNRRIEAVMYAIREQIASVSPYGSSGRRTTHALSCGTNVRA
jgi:hypothetical protein